METQDVKRWLKRGWHLEDDVKELIEQKEAMFALVTSTTSNPDNIAVDGTHDPHKLDGYVAFVERINKEIDKLCNVKAEIVEAVYKLDDWRYRYILMHRYIDYMEWKDIAEEMHYDVRHVTRLHSYALDVLRKIMMS